MREAVHFLRPADRDRDHSPVTADAQPVIFTGAETVSG